MSRFCKYLNTDGLNAARCPIILILSLFLPKILPGQFFDSSRDTTKSGFERYFSNAEAELRSSYTYGIPLVVSPEGTVHNYAISAQTGFNVLGMPLILTADYNSVQGFRGTNSFATVRLDKGELLRRKSLKYDQLLDSLMQKIKAVDLKMFELSGKLNYLEDKRNLDRLYPKAEIPDSLSLSQDLGKMNAEIADSVPHIQFDTSAIHIPTPKRSALDFEPEQVKEDPKHTLIDPEQLKSELEGLRREKDALESELEFVKSKAALFSSPLIKAQRENFIRKIISGLRDFQVGMARPTNSTFLLNGTPLVGVHFETEFDRYYGSISAGRIYRPTWGIKDEKTERKKLTEFLGLPSGGDKYDVIQLKAGLGKPMDNHLHFGVMRAKSKDYVISEVHSVLEISGGFAHKVLNFNIGAGLNPGTVNQAGEVSNLNDADENHLKERLAAKGRMQLKFDKIKGRITTIGEYWGNLFFSPGVGFQRPGLIRYEAAYDQRIGKKTKIKSFFGRDTDGLLGDATTYTEFTKWGAEVERRMGKAFVATAYFSPLSQQVNVHRNKESIFGEMNQSVIDSTVEIRGMMDSYLAGGTLNFTKRIKEFHYNITAGYRKYFMNYSQGNVEYDIVSVMLFFSVADKFNITLGSMALLSDGKSDFAESNIQNVMVSYQIGNGLRTTIEASSTQESNNRVYGGGMNLECALGKNFSFTVSANRLLKDDYYRRFLKPIYKISNPFRISTSITWKI